MLFQEHGDTLGRKFVRIKSDEEMQVIFTGQSKLAKVEWMGQGYELSDSDDASERIACNVYITAEQRMAVLEGPKSMAIALYNARLDKGDVVTINRTGPNNKPVWEIRRPREATAEEIEFIKTAEVMDLSNLWEPQDFRPDAPAGSTDEIPF